MRTEEWFEKATAYFNGSMTPEEAQLFEMETAASEELSELIHLWRSTDIEGIFYERYKDDAAKFISTHKKMKNDFVNEGKDKILTNVSKQIYLWKWTAIAATITGIIIVIKMLAPSSQKYLPVAEHKINTDSAKNIVAKDSAIQENIPGQPAINTETLYARVFSPDEIPGNPNGPLDDAFFYYASKQYKSAIRAIDSVGSKALTRGNNTLTPVIKFYVDYYKALSMMSLGNASEAIPLLKNALQISPSENFKAKAQWYLSLAYLKQGEISAAVNTLESLINNPSAGLYRSKSEKLLAALKK
jgi:tetratricopeptide (TPR) repeat protein